MEWTPVSRADLLRFVAGDELPEFVFDEITRQLQIEGSPVKRWLDAFDKKAAEPLNIDWIELGRLLTVDAPTADDEGINPTVPSSTPDESGVTSTRPSLGEEDVRASEEISGPVPTESESSLANYLDLEWSELMDEASMYSELVVHSADFLAPYRVQLEQVICREWDWATRRLNPSLQSQHALARAVEDLIIRNVRSPFPPALLAAILVREGLDSLCHIEDDDDHSDRMGL